MVSRRLPPRSIRLPGFVEGSRGQSRAGYPQRWVPATLRIADDRWWVASGGLWRPVGKANAAVCHCCISAVAKIPTLLTEQWHTAGPLVPESFPARIVLDRDFYRVLDRDSYLGPPSCGLLDRDSYLGPPSCGFPSAWTPNAERIPRINRPRRDSRSSGRQSRRHRVPLLYLSSAQDPGTAHRAVAHRARPVKPGLLQPDRWTEIPISVPPRADSHPHRSRMRNGFRESIDREGILGRAVGRADATVCHCCISAVPKTPALLTEQWHTGHVQSNRGCFSRTAGPRFLSRSPLVRIPIRIEAQCGTDSANQSTEKGFSVERPRVTLRTASGKKTRPRHCSQSSGTQPAQSRRAHEQTAACLRVSRRCFTRSFA